MILWPGFLRLGNDEMTKCGTGTIFDPETNSCILDDPIENEIFSNSVILELKRNNFE